MGLPRAHLLLHRKLKTKHELFLNKQNSLPHKQEASMNFPAYHSDINHYLVHQAVSGVSKIFPSLNIILKKFKSVARN